MFGKKVRHDDAADLARRGPQPLSSRVEKKRSIKHSIMCRFMSGLQYGRKQQRRRKRDFNEVEGKLGDDIKDALRESAARARDRVFLSSSTRIKLLLAPDGGFRAGWDGVFMIALCYAIFEVPYAVVFLESSCKWTWRESVNMFCDSIFLFDILVNFNTAYFDENSALIVNHWRIATHYLKTWFLVDLLSSLPLDRIICTSLDGSDDNASALRLFKILRIIKMVRIIRFLRVVKKWETFVGSGLLTKSIKLFKLAAFLLFSAHVSGCLWMLLLPWANCHTTAADLVPGALSAACDCEGEGCVDWNWLERYDPKLASQGSPESKYLACVYFSIVTLSTVSFMALRVGYGEIFPTNDFERLFAILLALMGAVVFALCIGSISNLATEGNKSENIVEDGIREVLDFLTYVRVPRSLQHRAQRQLLHASGKAPHKFHRWLDHVPLHIRKHVVTSLAIEDTEKIPFLARMDFDAKARLAALFSPCLLRPGEVLFQALDTTSEMYFVVRGTLEVWDLLGSRVVERLGVGDMVGEGGMFVSEKVPFSYSTVKAKTECELLELSRQDFHQHIKPLFPDLYNAVRELHEEHSKYLDRQGMVELMCRRSAARCRGFVNQLHNLRLAMREVSRAQKVDPALVARPLKFKVAVPNRLKRLSYVSAGSVKPLSSIGSRAPSDVTSDEFSNSLARSASRRGLKLSRISSEPWPVSVAAAHQGGRRGSTPVRLLSTTIGRATSSPNPSTSPSFDGTLGKATQNPARAEQGASTTYPPGYIEETGAVSFAAAGVAGQTEGAEGRQGGLRCAATSMLEVEVEQLRGSLHARMNVLEEGVQAMTAALQALPLDDPEQRELKTPMWWSVAPFGVASSNLFV